MSYKNKAICVFVFILAVSYCIGTAEIYSKQKNVQPASKVPLVLSARKARRISVEKFDHILSLSLSGVDMEKEVHKGYDSQKVSRRYVAYFTNKLGKPTSYHMYGSHGGTWVKFWKVKGRCISVGFINNSFYGKWTEVKSLPTTPGPMNDKCDPWSKCE